MMNNEPARILGEQENETPRKDWKKQIGSWLTNHWGWKLISLVLAICLWGALISQDTTLPRDKMIDDVRITVTNSATLRSNGFIVVSGLEDLSSVRLRVTVPQKYYSTVTAANYSVRLDLSQIREAGEQTLKLSASTTNSSLYGTVNDILSPDVKVIVEEYATQSKVPVEVHLTGEVPDGYYITPLSFSTQYVDIGGPRSIVDNVARCVVEYDQSTLSPNRNPNTASLPFTFQDAQGNTLDSANLSVTASGQSAALQRIAVSQYAYLTAKVPVSTISLTQGQVAEGYEVTGITIFPETVTIAASGTMLAPYLQGNVSFYTYDKVDITNARQNISTYLTLRTPSTMEYISDNIVQVTVKIEPVSSQTESMEPTP